MYGHVEIGTLRDMIVESINRLAALGMTRQEIADALDVASNTVGKYIRENNIPVTDRRKPPKKKLADKTVEEYQELIKTMTYVEICEEWDTNLVTLRQWRKENGL